MSSPPLNGGPVSDDAVGLTVRCESCLALGVVKVTPAAGQPPCPACGHPILLDQPRPVGPRDFDATVLRSPLPVIASFSADWCAPCAWLEPYLREIAEAGRGRLLVAKLDVDAAPELALRYRVASVPVVILFREGVEVERSLGVEPSRLLEMAAEARKRKGPRTAPGAEG